jgi:hypothetical protein
LVNSFGGNRRFGCTCASLLCCYVELQRSTSRSLDRMDDASFYCMISARRCEDTRGHARGRANMFVTDSA